MIDEDRIRALVRTILANQVPGATVTSAPPPSPNWKSHFSHGRFLALAPVEPDAPCVVEPHVRCNHCGFCQSYGH